MSASEKTYGLVLAGGGARAAYQAGVMKALSQILPSQKNPFQVLVGTSAGAINAAFLAAHAENWKDAGERLADLWRGLTLEQVYRTDSFSLSRIAMGWITRLLFGNRFAQKKTKSNFLLDTSPLRKLLEKEVDFEKIRINLDKNILKGLAFTATQYFSGTTVSFYESAAGIQAWTRSNHRGVRTPLQAEHIMASAAIPIFFPPIIIGDQYYGDGSLRQITPLSPAIHLGANKIVSIGIHHGGQTQNAVGDGSFHREPPSLAQITGELMNSMFLDSLDSDVERAQNITKGIQSVRDEFGGQPLGYLREISILQLAPSQDLLSLLPSTLNHFPITLRFLLRGLGVSSQQGNSLISYLSFLPECSNPLMELGVKDTFARKEEILRFFEAD